MNPELHVYAIEDADGMPLGTQVPEILTAKLWYFFVLPHESKQEYLNVVGDRYLLKSAFKSNDEPELVTDKGDLTAFPFES